MKNEWHIDTLKDNKIHFQFILDFPLKIYYHAKGCIYTDVRFKLTSDIAFGGITEMCRGRMSYVV